MVIDDIPASLGFRMPAEWHKHARTIMAWPVVEAEWPGPLEEILEAYSDAVKKIAMFEPVTMIARGDLMDQVHDYCGSAVEIMKFINDDSWTRDNGPTFVINNKGEIAGINWIFNAWGGKYPCENDNRVAPAVLKHYNIPRFDAPIVMEGGSIHVDGEGTLLTTEECLLNINRNPHLTREKIEDRVKKYLNIQKIVWLKEGLYGDDTDGHIDNVACFAKPGVIITQVCSDPNAPDYQRSQNNLEILRSTTDAKGRTFEIIEIEQPNPVVYDGLHLTLSYLNFYFVNGGIILPVFGGENSTKDVAAIEKLKEVFPDRKIVAINGLPLTRGGGNIHCLTQQMPEGIPARL
ncbi:agmatine deiminase family protein [Petroclostridium sp. X23]|jgi:agmatine deiminase|uniref:agmatine deiminase family protein n=1 Tax=Petroclostridium sp. X23 TaxID=3045146 RepID=UPI0024AD1D4B|nr:agmatine deiminase family protein [Petroclostridium sp. X23]WHH58521.1 agmatine deiminase family protein [Petroclostridium sp. X23]